MANNRLAIGGAAMAALSACSSVNNQIADIVFIPNPNSDRRSEEVTIDLAYSLAKPCVPDNASPNACDWIGKPRENKEEVSNLQAMAGAPFAADAAQLVISQLKRTLADEAERYTATYSASASGSQFYHFHYATTQGSTPSVEPKEGPRGEGLYRDISDVKFAGFRLQRWVDPKRKKDSSRNDEKDAAMRVCAIALPSLDDAFVNIVPVSYEFRYSKAKIIGFNMLSPFGVDLLNPWEIVTDPLSGRGLSMPPMDRDLDVTVGVSFQHMFVSGSKLQSEQTQTEEFHIPAARVTGEAERGYFPQYEKFLAAIRPSKDVSTTGFELDCDAATPEVIAALRDKIMNEIPVDHYERMKLESSAKAVPSARRSLQRPGKPAIGNANFTLNVLVTETDDYGSRITTLNESFEKESGGLQKRLQNFLDPK